MTTQTLRGVWTEAHPLNPWRYDFPERDMAPWEMPTYRALIPLHRLAIRFVVIWHLIATPANTSELAPWDAGLPRRLKTIAALLLPIPVRWRYPGFRDSADGVLTWWSSGTVSTPDGLSWRAYCVGVGYGWNFRAYIYDDGA